MREYALYKGDDLLSIGTIGEIAKEMKVQRSTIAYYRTQAYQNRLQRRNAINGNVRMLVALDDEEELDGQSNILP